MVALQSKRRTTASFPKDNPRTQGKYDSLFSWGAIRSYFPRLSGADRSAGAAALMLRSWTHGHTGGDFHDESTFRNTYHFFMPPHASYRLQLLVLLLFGNFKGVTSKTVPTSAMSK
jgi:hypothetical protein